MGVRGGGVTVLEAMTDLYILLDPVTYILLF